VRHPAPAPPPAPKANPAAAAVGSIGASARAEKIGKLGLAVRNMRARCRVATDQRGAPGWGDQTSIGATPRSAWKKPAPAKIPNHEPPYCKWRRCGCALRPKGRASQGEGGMRSGQGVRPFAVSLLGEFLPLPCHILQNSTVALALGLARHAAAFLGKSPVFGCGFHAGTTRRSTGLFRTHSALCLRNRLRHRTGSGLRRNSVVVRLNRAACCFGVWPAQIKTPPSGRGGVLGPQPLRASRRSWVPPINSPARPKFRPPPGHN
jgi:hypothetical protein